MNQDNGVSNVVERHCSYCGNNEAHYTEGGSKHFPGTKSKYECTKCHKITYGFKTLQSKEVCRS